MSEDLFDLLKKYDASRDVSLSAAYPYAMTISISQDRGNWLLVLRNFLS